MMELGISLPENYNLHEYQSLGSTNDEALILAPTSPDKTVIWAREQTNARGRRGRTWQAPPGNLYCSIILKPDVAISECSQLGYVAALAIFDTLIELCPTECKVSCKWPNDVLLNGKKVSGILLESSLSNNKKPDWVILGVGINVVAHPDDTEFPATDMSAEGTRQATAPLTLERFIAHFEHWSNLWAHDGFAQLRQTWLDCATGLGKKIIVRLENQQLSGTFMGLDETGALILRPDNEVNDRIITAGDVFFPNT